jgi:glutamyl-Q tRNA(Asp) synthetase
MRFLGFDIDKEISAATLDEIILWGVENWRVSQLPSSTEITPIFSNRSL